MSVLDTNTEDDMVSKLRDLAKVGPSAFYLYASYKYLVSNVKTRFSFVYREGYGDFEGPEFTRSKIHA